MTEIQLYNTRTRTKELFQPIDPKNVRMYVCGPTVYDRAHIGNARPVVVFDVLYRLLRHVYGEKAVTYARNFTDVDDRIINRAVETKGAGESLEAATRRITDETIAWYHEDMDALGALRPDAEPRCTEFIRQMVAMTEKLIDQGNAYEAEGHVLFAVETYDRYGKLAGRSLDDMIAGSRVEVAPYKKNPMDFVLWKPSTPEQPGWDGPKINGKEVGRGRPGWHIECSAMAQAILGDVFDIHGGGIDLQFPHHENEVAQSCCANHTDVMANVWMHNGFLQVEGEKMAKSLGNFFTVKDLRGAKIGPDRLILRSELHSSRGPKGRPLLSRVIRICLLMTHYRQPLDWTFERVKEADRLLHRMSSALREGRIDYGSYRSELPDELVDILADDLNTPEAIGYLSFLADSARRSPKAAARLLASMEFMGIIEDTSYKRIAFQRALSALATAIEQFEELGIDPNSVFDELSAISNRDYRFTAMYVANKLSLLSQPSAMSDDDRRAPLDLAHPDVSSKDKNRIYKRVKLSKIKDLFRMRANAKREGNFEKADRIRDTLNGFGIEVVDLKDYPVWRPK